LSPVAHALAERGLAPRLVLTSQHPTLDAAEFGLEGFEVVRLECPGQHDPHAHVQAVAAATRPLLADAPDLLVVQGDTSSALGAAVAAFAAHIPVAHVEAGLRTRDPRNPWPEEEYRTAIDAEADLLFAPTDLAALNLACERVPGEVFVTGNTAIDALLAIETALTPDPLRETGPAKLLVTCHRRESWGKGLRAIAAALIELARGRSCAIDVILHPNPQVAATMRAALEGVPGIALHPPCSHSELVRRMRESTLVLTDSGGMQEEAPALGVALLILREKTERPEGIATGNLRLVGASTERIVTETRRLLGDPAALAAMSRRAFPYGDGKAAPRIAAHIERWLARCAGGKRIRA
jgi:UDP-N-acetylglucosamine 2-epimerase (non-hydrolysing)